MLCCLSQRRGRELRGMAIAPQIGDLWPAARQRRLACCARDQDRSNPRPAKARAEAANFVHLVNCHRNSMARRAIAMISERNSDAHGYDASNSKNPIIAAQWQLAMVAANDRSQARIPSSARWFYIRNRDDEPAAPVRRWQYPNARYWGTYGEQAPLRNVGGGDVGPGNNIVVDIYYEPE